MEAQEKEDRLKLVRTLLLTISVMASFSSLSIGIPVPFLFSLILLSVVYYAELVNGADDIIVVLTSFVLSGVYTIFFVILLQNNGLGDFFWILGASAIMFPVSIYALKPREIRSSRVLSAVYGIFQRIFAFIPLISLRSPSYAGVEWFVSEEKVQEKINQFREKMYDRN